MCSSDLFPSHDRCGGKVSKGKEKVYVEKETLIKNQPEYEVCNPANVIIDPTCDGDLSKATFVAHEYNTSLAELKKEIRFLNLSYTNPYSWMTKPIAAMFLNYGKPWNQKVKEAAWNVVEPFFSPELTAQTLGQLYYNINERTDRPIYNPGLGPFGDWDNTRSFLLWNLQPGVSKLTLDMYSAISGKSINNRVPKELPDVLMGLMGMQVERLNLEKAVTSKMVSHRKEKEYARDVFTDSKFNYKDDPEGLKARLS